MEHRLNKPRVFLSHSKKDEKFIGELYEDLRKCQIDPWMDTEEIRDGKSWLKVIFEDGIPTCDVVLVYFTDSSIASKMVGREADAALVEHLSEKGVVFLPYVENESLRVRLRADIRSLHCRIWNESNYSEILPTVVAEIWHSYLERTVEAAISHEKTRRLELEIEVARLRESNAVDIFSFSENNDFQNIYDQLKTNVEISYDLWEKDKDAKETGNRLGRDRFTFSLLDLLVDYVRTGRLGLDYHALSRYPVRLLETHQYPSPREGKSRYYGNTYMRPDFIINVIAYGLVRRVQTVDSSGRTSNRDLFTEKMYRFLYWMQYTNREIKEANFAYLGFEENIE